MTTPFRIKGGVSRSAMAVLAALGWLPTFGAQAEVVAGLRNGEGLNIAAIGFGPTDETFTAQNYLAQVGEWLASRYPDQVSLSHRAVSRGCSCFLPAVRWVLVGHRLVGGTAAAGGETDGKAGASGKPTPGRVAPENPRLVKLPFAFPGLRMENTPVVYRDRPLLVQNYRSLKADEQESGSYLFIEDLTTGQEIARFGTGFSFVSAFVNGDEMNVFGTVNTNKEWTKDVFRFRSTDLKTWKQELVITRDGDEHLFNTSVCRDDQGYVMAYESNKPVQWSFRFARSKDLSHWQKVAGLEFADVEGQTACGNPTIRYYAPYYYMVYGIWRWKGPGTRYEYLLPETKYVTAVARSKDLITWEVSPTRAPMLDPVPGEGINNTDADLFEFGGNTYIYYATGDQATWGTIRVAMYAGAMKEMLEAYFPEGVPTVIKFDTRQRRYIYPQ